MYEDLVLELRVDDDLVDLVSFQFFLLHLHESINLNVAVSHGDIPDADLALTIANEQPALVVEGQTVGMSLVEVLLLGTLDDGLAFGMHQEVQGLVFEVVLVVALVDGEFVSVLLILGLFHD